MCERVPETIVTDKIAEQIDQIAKKSRAELLLTWQEHFSQEPPAKLRKELMVPILCYRIQEREEGGLPQSARRRLRQIAQSLRAEKRAAVSSVPRPQAGTRLMRSWRG